MCRSLVKPFPGLWLPESLNSARARPEATPKHFQATDALRPHAAAWELFNRAKPGSKWENHHLMQWRSNGSRSARPKWLQKKEKHLHTKPGQNLDTFPSIDSDSFCINPNIAIPIMVIKNKYFPGHNWLSFSLNAFEIPWRKECKRKILHSSFMLTVFIIISIYFLSINSMTVLLFEVFPGCYSIAPTFLASQLRSTSNITIFI